MKRLFAMLAAATVAASLLVGGAPNASALVGPVGGGVVSGEVALSPGVDVASNRLAGDLCDLQTYTFSGVVLTGFISDGERTMAAPIEVSNVKGNTTNRGDCGDSGEGVVNTSADKATFAASTPVGSASGDFYGQYMRLGTHVRVVLSASIRLCSDVTGCASYSNVPVVLDASEFFPTEVNSQGRATKANFTGEFHIGVPEPYVGLPY